MLALVVDSSLSGHLSLYDLRGRPLEVISDNCAELDLARDPCPAAGAERGLARHRRRKPMQNGFVEP